MTQPAPIREPSLSLQDAALELGVSVGTLRNWVWQQKIGSFKVGRVRIPVSEIQRLKRAAWRPARKGVE